MRRWVMRRLQPLPHHYFSVSAIVYEDDLPPSSASRAAHTPQASAYRKMLCLHYSALISRHVSARYAATAKCPRQMTYASMAMEVYASTELKHVHIAGKSLFNGWYADVDIGAPRG